MNSANVIARSGSTGTQANPNLYLSQGGLAPYGTAQYRKTEQAQVAEVKTQNQARKAPAPRDPYKHIWDGKGFVDMEATRLAAHTVGPGQSAIRYVDMAKEAEKKKAEEAAAAAAAAAQKTAAPAAQPSDNPPAEKPPNTDNASTTPSTTASTATTDTNGSATTPAPAAATPKPPRRGIWDEHGEVDLEASRLASLTAKPGEKVTRYFGETPPTATTKPAAVDPANIQSQPPGPTDPAKSAPPNPAPTSQGTALPTIPPPPAPKAPESDPPSAPPTDGAGTGPGSGENANGGFVAQARPPGMNDILGALKLPNPPAATSPSASPAPVAEFGSRQYRQNTQMGVA